MTTYHDSIRELIRGRSLSEENAEALMSAIIEGLLDQPQVAATLTALAMRTPSSDELAGFARVMRRHMLSIDTPAPAFDPCGTGGSGLETANTSTMSAFILAGAGVTVAKHGNRASSGKCGSMDVLERLGVFIELAPDQARSLAQTSPIVFVFARRHHPALGQVTPVRRVLGFPTVFNFLGPICNPAGARRQLMGVSNSAIAGTLVETLRKLGSDRVATVYGLDGLDEISLEAPTRLWHLQDGEVGEMLITPNDFGVPSRPFSDWAGGDVATNAAIFDKVINGGDNSAHTVHTAMNAGAALWVAGLADSLRDGYELARETLDSGAARAAFEEYRALSAGFA